MVAISKKLMHVYLLCQQFKHILLCFSEDFKIRIQENQKYLKVLDAEREFEDLWQKVERKGEMFYWSLECLIAIQYI